EVVELHGKGVDRIVGSLNNFVQRVLGKEADALHPISELAEVGEHRRNGFLELVDLPVLQRVAVHALAPSVEQFYRLCGPLYSSDKVAKNSGRRRLARGLTG